MPTQHQSERKAALAAQVRWAEMSLHDALAIARELPGVAYWAGRIPGRRERLRLAREALEAWEAKGGGM